MIITASMRRPTTALSNGCRGKSGELTSRPYNMNASVFSAQLLVALSCRRFTSSTACIKCDSFLL